MAATAFPRTNEADAEAMLRFIQADDRDLWVKIGGILKDEFGDAGFPIWDDWSQTSERYRARDARDVWRSLGRNAKRAGIGTLIYLAREHGWKPGPRVSETIPKPRFAPTLNANTSGYSGRIWLASRVDDSTVGNHPYAVRKGIRWAAGAGRATVSGCVIGQGADCLVVPVRDLATGKVVAVQAINTEGAKQSFGLVSGHAFVCGNTLGRAIRWFVVEGWADAVSMVFHHFNGNAVAMAAMGKGNMQTVAERAAKIYAPEEITIIEDRP